MSPHVKALPLALTSLVLGIACSPAAASGDEVQARSATSPAREFSFFASRLTRELLAGDPAFPIPLALSGSQLGPDLPPVRRLRALLEVLVQIESGGVHRDHRGILLTSQAPGSPVGYTQISRTAAQEALRWGQHRDLPGFTSVEEDGESLRSRWTWNLRLGMVYLLELHSQELVRAPREDGEARADPLLRALVAYLMGPSTAFLDLPEKDFERECSLRPEVKRYLRHSLQLLEIPPSPSQVEALSGRLTRKAGGWEAEALQVRARRHRLFSSAP